MTGRERFLAALRCERVDEVPYTVTLDGFNLTADTPPELLNPFDMVALCHWAGGMVHDRLDARYRGQTSARVSGRIRR